MTKGLIKGLGKAYLRRATEPLPGVMVGWMLRSLGRRKLLDFADVG